MNLLTTFTTQLNTKTVPDLRPGMTVRVHQKIKEGNKTRVQMFEGIVIARKHGSQPTATVTVRKVSNGIGVERIFPLQSPTVEKFEIVRSSKVRRAKLYYLRTKSAREARKKTKIIETKTQETPTEEKAE